MAITVEHIFSLADDAKLHGALLMMLARVVCKILRIFPQLEAIQPRCVPGIQHLSALHIAIDKAESVLEHCAECSKLYLAVTGDAVLAKLMKLRSSFQQSLSYLESMLPQKLASQIGEILKELEEMTLELDPLERQAGKDLITLLQKSTSDWNDSFQVDVFRQTAATLGIISQTAVLTEKRALKKMLEKAHFKEDKKKASILSYFLHLLSLNPRINYETMEEDFQNSGSYFQPSEYSTASANSERGDEPECSANLVIKGVNPSMGELLVPPDEFKCPISMKLMFDPVVIASGQTFERVCIEKWFSEGHNTCPKTKQILPHLNITPNYCIKGLIASWCEKNGVKFPDSSSEPSPMLFSNWHVSDKTDMEDQQESVVLRGSDGAQVHELGPSTETHLNLLHGIPDMKEASDSEDGLPSPSISLLKTDESISTKVKRLLTTLTMPPLESQMRALEEIRALAEDDKACSCIHDSDVVPAIVKFLQTAFADSEIKAQSLGTLALLSISRNNRNKEAILSAGALPLLLDFIHSGPTEEATDLLLELSYIDSEKINFIAFGAIPFLFELLESESFHCRKSALGVLCNLSTIIHEWNMMTIESVTILTQFLSIEELRGKCLTIMNRLADSEAGRRLIAETEGCIPAVVEVLDEENSDEQEQALDILILLSTNCRDHCQLVLREGVIPYLVNISVNGSVNGAKKAQKLLEFFRDERIRDSSYTSDQISCNNEMPSDNQRHSTESRTAVAGNNPKQASRKRKFFSNICTFLCKCTNSRNGKQNDLSY